MAVLGQWDSGTLPTTHGAGVSYAASGGWDGRPAIQFSQQSGDVSQVRFEFAAVSEFAVRAYIQMPAAWASTSASLIVARSDSATIVGRAAIGGTGAPGEARLIRHDPSATVSASGNGTLDLSEWYRFELRINQTTGQGRLGVFPLGSDTPLWDSTWQTSTFGASTYRIELGPASTSPTLGQIRVANILATDDSSGWLGRAAGDTLGGGGSVLGQWDSGALPTTHGAGVSYVANGGWDGRPAIQFEQQAGDVSQVRFEFSSTTSVAARAYIQMPAGWSSSSASLMVARPNSASIAGRMAIGGTSAPGEMRLIRADPAATVTASGSGTLALATWYRFELQLNHATGQGRTAVFALGSDTPLWDSGWQTADFGASSYRIEIGPASTSPTLGQIRATNLFVTDDVSSWIGRAAGDDGVPPAPQTSWRIRTAGGWTEAFAHEI